MSIAPLYEYEDYHRHKSMTDMPLICVYDKVIKIEQELYAIKMQVSRLIEKQTDDGR